MTALSPQLLMAGRVLLSLIFIVAGAQKLFNYAGTQQFMESAGLPGILLPAVILVELGGGLAILAGFMTRWVALALAGFSVLAAVLFHLDFGNQMQTIMLMKNLAIAGGFLALAAAGPGAFALDKA
jgi:putative oxidoreductase